MTTARDICTQALKKSGVLAAGIEASAEDMNDAFLDLNDIMSQWQVQRWLVYRLQDLSKVSTGAQSYTVGPAADFPMAVRPDLINSGFFRQLLNATPNQVDFPMKIITAREDYNRITLKNLQTFPRWCFYDSDWPLGRIYPWPVPQVNVFEIHLSVKQVLQRFANLATTVALPDGYEPALKWALAVRLRVSYQMSPDPSLDKLCAGAVAIVKGSNTQIATLHMPTRLRRASLYNIYSDDFY